MGFPNKINYNWAVGFPGGIASANPDARPFPARSVSALVRLA
ncbi:hypothetical protein [Asaia sp. HumB]|nr:hypothetical protein [Asaia sp. HumB]MDL2169564.1 hypothetical protein [Asaia sp. HumB]MDL2172476.1 hypothetical protein [Asaia sp. HumB]